MSLPIFYSILACFFWGLIFVVPFYLKNFYCVDIVLGRYLIFGIFSVILLTFHFINNKSWTILSFWKQAGLCALVMNFGYYTSLILAMRFSNPSIIALIVGMAPIVVVILACKTEKNTSPYNLFLGPSFCIFFGIVLINIRTIQAEWHNITILEYLYGLFYGFFCLGAWSWYVVYNTHLLQKNPQINPRQWTTLIGAITLIFVLIGIGWRWLAIKESPYMEQFSISKGQGLNFIGSIFLLGIVCSWLAYTLWNTASSKLPSQLSGQLAILETIFGLIFIYSIQSQLPSYLEVAGIGLVLGGVWKGLYNSSKQKVTSKST